jgi:hypothetical protein
MLLRDLSVQKFFVTQHLGVMRYNEKSEASHATSA